MTVHLNRESVARVAIGAFVLSVACGRSSRNGDGHSVAGAGTGGAGAVGEAGSGATDVTMRACSVNDEAVPRVQVLRMDAGQGTCTSLGFEAYLGGGCALLESNGWCLYQARVASNVSDAAACLMGTALADAVVAESATGSFSVAADTIEIDVELRFPENSELSTLGIEGSSCSADCSAPPCQ